MKKFVIISILLLVGTTGFGQTNDTFDGYLEVISPYKTLVFKVITKDLKNKPIMYMFQHNSDKHLFTKELPSTDTTLVDFGKLKLEDGLYELRIKDSNNAEYGHTFVVRNKKN